MGIDREAADRLSCGVLVLDPVAVRDKIEFLLRHAVEERRKGRRAGEGDRTGDD